MSQRFAGPEMMEKRIKLPKDLHDRLKVHCYNSETRQLEYVFIIEAVRERLDRIGAE